MMADFNLVDSFFDKRHGFEAAVLCSYSLNLNFFENYLLKLPALYTCNNIALFVDAQTYAQFQHTAYIPHALNRRYLVSWLKTKGVFHSKLYLLASPKKAIIGIGSANLTREGIASNLELLTTFEVSERDQTFASLLGDCVTYVQRLARLTQSSWAQDQVAALADCCRSFMQTDNKSWNGMQLLHNLDRPLLNEFATVLSGHPVTKIQIISPFFDAQLAPLRELETHWPNCLTEIHIQQHKSNFPKNLLNNLSAAVRLYRDIDRYLHGKAILFHTPEQIYLFIGSANFTDPALLQLAAQGNFEVGLMGAIDTETADVILQPAGQAAVAISEATEIIVDARSEFPSPGSVPVPYLVEAVLKNNRIQIETNPTISATQFQPKRYRLVSFDENSFEGSLPSDLIVTLTAEVRKKVQGRFGVQITGVNAEGWEQVSNLVWVIDWDDRDVRGPYRRIYRDPSELFNILEEIVATGDERELMLFLQNFDIPLDLLLPPRSIRGLRNVKSKGNVIGMLPLHQSKFFSGDVLNAYNACLERLLGKMKKHLLALQSDKIDNFILIFNTSLVLLDFVNSWVSEKYRDKPTITGADWLLVRDCYDMLLKHTTIVWELVWGKDGYRNQMNIRLMEHVQDEGEPTSTFEAYLVADYDNSVAELQEFVLRPLQTFKKLLLILQIRTQQGKLVPPKIFPNHHVYLEQPMLDSLEQQVSQVGAQFLI